jgi:KUP system potassium uptake protein
MEVEGSKSDSSRSAHQKLSLAGLIITLGIVYGDIGTSPLYVVKAIGDQLGVINKETILGALSCVFWTLTLQTTIKYVIITLRADNNGEGGIFALFALLRKKHAWAYVLALIGGGTLLADGIITPAITVTSSIEGLNIIYPDIPVVPIVLSILTVLFFVQQFGTHILGKSFGPLMIVWFSIIAVLGGNQLFQNTEVLAAINPLHALNLLANHPGGFLVMGAVFLATTGAEALYSDLGHCGIRNIRISWIFVKIALLFSYFGQAAWVLRHPDFAEAGLNPFYAIMPQWFIIPGIIIATIAAVIASQALISGSYTLVSEAISLNLWPKMKIKYPSDLKGQMYIPNINLFLWLGSVSVVLLFQSSSHMEAAYGLSITITMLMTTSLLMLFLHKRIPLFGVIVIGTVYITLELVFLLANLNKFSHGGWFTILIGGVLSSVMYVWYNGRIIKNRLVDFISVKPLLEILKKMKEDTTIPKFASNLVYITKANHRHEIESTIVYSLLHKQPKRADKYWFLHIDIGDRPYTFEYRVTEFVKDSVYKIDFYIGFRIEPRVSLFFKHVLKELARNEGLDITSQYPSLNEYAIQGDRRYVIIDRILTAEHYFPFKEKVIMNLSNMVGHLAITDTDFLNLDASNVFIEKVPLGNADKLTLPFKQIK